MNGAEGIARALVRHGLTRVYSHAGGTISLILDAIDRAGIRVVTAVNEAQAVHMAQGAYRVSGRAQVALCTSGPGVTNAVTGVADAYYDQDAVVLLAGQVAIGSMRGDRPVRQWGFQECPTVDVMRPISKGAFYPIATGCSSCMDAALRYAAAPRPGPVVLELPMDIVAGPDDPELITRFGPPYAESCEAPDREDVRRVVGEMMAAARPVIIAGRGCLSATEELRAFVEAHPRVPVVTSMPAVGAIPTDWLQCFGMLGHTGTEQANRAVADADFVLALGVRLDVRQTGTLADSWSDGKTVVVVDYDAGELTNKRVRVDQRFKCEAAEWLREVMA